MMSITVGQLAALINILTLVSVTFVDRFVEYVVRNFSLARLRTKNKAPIIHDSDTWLLNIPRSILKYYKYPAILFVLICTLLLISSELISELGVESKKDCGPKPVVGEIISNFSIEKVADAEIAAAGLAISRLKFNDKNSFTFLPQGFPRQLNENTCISCYKANDTNYILRNCTVGEPQEENEYSLNILRTETAFGTVANSFVDHNGTEYSGPGDLTRNLHACGMFIFQPESVITTMEIRKKYKVHYFEYVESISECQHIIDKAGSNSPFETKAQSSILKYSIECEAYGDLGPGWFEKSLRAYRAMQLENTMDVAKVVNGRFPMITEEDVYRAVLSAKVIDNAPSGNATYHEYFECGTYDGLFILPFLSILCAILLLGLRSFLEIRKYRHLRIPHSSRTWFDEVHVSNSQLSTARQRPNRSYFDLSTDEFVIDGESVAISSNEDRRKNLQGMDTIGTSSNAVIDMDMLRYSAWSESSQLPAPVYSHPSQFTANNTNAFRS